MHAIFFCHHMKFVVAMVTEIVELLQKQIDSKIA